MGSSPHSGWMWPSAPSPGSSPGRADLRLRLGVPSSPTMGLVSIDFFTVPTARLRVLFVLVVLAHHRRRVLTSTSPSGRPRPAPPSRSSTPFRATPPAYLLRNRDTNLEDAFRRRVQ